MSELIYDCPRCGAKLITFDMMATWPLHKHLMEAFCACRGCKLSVVFLLHSKYAPFGPETFKGQKVVNDLVVVEGHVALRNSAEEAPPEHLPEDIEKTFKEGARCMTVGCYNAAAVMFRLCLDLASRQLLPPPNETPNGLNNHKRDKLSLRLRWLFENGKLPQGLAALSDCIKDDGNDAAHNANLTSDDAQDILEFSFELLDRLYTEPRKLEIAQQRRNARRIGG